MHPPIERYLRQVERQLKCLPTEQRAEELREIEHHLQALVEEGERQGLNHNDAVTTALRQFGPSRKVGREIRHACTTKIPLLLRVTPRLIALQAGLRIVLLWALLWLTVIQAQDKTAPLGLWQSCINATLIQCGVMLIAIGVRLFRQDAFWLALAYEGQAAIFGASTIYEVLKVPTSALEWHGLNPTLEMALVLWCPQLLHLFALFVLLSHWKSYMALSTNRRSRPHS